MNAEELIKEWAHGKRAMAEHNDAGNPEPYEERDREWHLRWDQLCAAVWDIEAKMMQLGLHGEP